jgi:hypothetical protein
MNSIVDILVIITIATTWVDYARPLIDKWDYKPFNCSFCLTFWLSLIYFLITLDQIILITPLILRIIERRLL